MITSGDYGEALIDYREGPNRLHPILSLRRKAGVFDNAIFKFSQYSTM